MRQIILDTETTGFYHDGDDRLVEFAGLEMVGRKLTGRSLHLYVHPERDIPEEASRIHGITLDQLEGKPTFAGVAAEISEFIRGAALIIHNAPFDMGFLDMEFTRLGLPSAREQVGEVIDTTASLPWKLSTVPTATSPRPAAASSSRMSCFWALYGATTMTSPGTSGRGGAFSMPSV